MAVKLNLRRTLVGWTFGLSIGYAILAIALNHFMLVFNESMARLTFYLLICGIPVGLISATKSLVRVHRGSPRDDFREGFIPIAFGFVLAACIYGVSFLSQ